MIVPWRREYHGSSTHPDGKKNLKTMGTRLLLLVGAACVTALVTFLWFTLTSPRPRTTVVTQIDEGTLLDVWGDLCLFRTGDDVLALSLSSTKVTTARGSRGSIVKGGEHPVLSVVDDGVVSGYDSSGWHRVYRLTGKEDVLPARGDSPFLVFGPENDIEYGSSWRIKAADVNGRVLWQMVTPFLPFAAACSHSNLAVAALDLSQTSRCHLLLMEAGSGTAIKTVDLGMGFWRDLYVVDNSIVAVLNTTVVALNEKGDIAWKFSPGGEVVASCFGEEGLALICLNRYGFPLDKVLSRTRLIFMTREGAVLWEKGIKLSAHMVAFSRSAIIASDQDHMIGFSCQDGRIRFSLRVTYPLVRVSGDVIFLRKNGGYVLCKLVEDPEGP